MSFLNKKENKDIIAIFDIGSSSIGGAIVILPDNKKSFHPTIVAYLRSEIDHKKEISYDSLLKDMLSSLDKNTKSLYEQKKGAPSRIICVLASPWYETNTKVLKIQKDIPFVFNEKTVSLLIQKEINSKEMLHKEKFGDSDDIPEIFEKQTLGVCLNGYQVADPIGKKTTSIELDMVISVSPKSFLQSIRETFEKVYHSTPVSFSSFVLDSFIAVRDRYNTLDSYMLVDVGGDVTDVTLVRKNVIHDVVSFPFGKKTLITQIADKLDLSLRDATELFRLYSTDTMKDNLKQKMIVLMKSIEESYSSLFYNSLSVFVKDQVISSPMFLTTDTIVSAWFKSVFQKEKLINSLFYNESCTVISLENKDFSDICKIKDCTCDPFLMIEAIAYTKKNNKK